MTRDHRDHRDLVIEMLADNEAELIDRVVSLTIERDGYRELLGVTLERSHTLTLRLERAREAHHRPIEESRCFRERVMREPTREHVA